jgi:Nucleotidyl transferase AbiEii toxin, Type IV TA system
MTELESALVEIASFLDEMQWPYMLIGGLAMALWGEPRATLDVDVSVWVEPEAFEDAVRKIGASFRTVPDALEFAPRSRVVPRETSQSVRGDLVLGALPQERNLISRARERAVGGVPIRVASVEDLILMKLISERQKDLDDATRLLRRYGSTLDTAYLEPELQQFAEALDRPDIINLYQTEMRRPR